jgi:LysR family transcriptional regulator, low CO2-responsive transcriptional regulator
MNYTLHQLKVFSTIVQCQSVTRAAELLHMTQPAVSIQLKNLQDQFDIPLTEVIGRRIHITDFGQELATLAGAILSGTAEIEQRMLARKGLVAGKMRFSVVSTGKYILPYYLSAFNKKYPHVELAIDVTNRSRVIESLQENETDFALVSILPEQLELEEEKLMPNALWLVAGKDWALEASQPPYDIAILKEIPIIYRERGSGTRILMEEYTRKVAIQPRVKLELTSSEAIKQAVIAGLGASILSVHSLRAELQSGTVRMLPVKGFPLYSHWRLIWLKGKRHSPASEAFLALIRENKEAIFQQHFAWTAPYIEA